MSQINLGTYDSSSSPVPRLAREARLRAEFRHMNSWRYLKGVLLYDLGDIVRAQRNMGWTWGFRGLG